MPRINISQHSKEQIEIYIHQVHQSIQNLMNNATNNGDELRDIHRQLRKAYNRSCELQNRSFIVLVVGPVKSGKSTLVNIVANAYVSPTHFLECTVRPSIITHHAEDRRIITYTSTDIENRAEQFDSIIDCLRGLDSYENIPNIDVNRGEDGNGLPLTRENIDAQVALDLALIDNDNTLTTTITTPGGTLLQNDVFLMDMPGIDGKYANIDNPIYTTIAQRADLIIFVQSSNSAVNMASNDFLDILYANNPSVHVCLIHNVFDAAYWRTEESRFENARVQKEFAITEIRGKGFIVDEGSCFSINLGKVEDAQKDEFQNNEVLQRELTEFRDLEQILYNKIIADRDRIRTGNCYNRTWDQIERLQELVNTILVDMQQRLDRYNNVVNAFAAIDINQLLAIDNVDRAAFRGLISFVNIINRIDNLYQQNNTNLPVQWWWHTGVRDRVKLFLNRCETEISTLAYGDIIVNGVQAIIDQKTIIINNDLNTLIIQNGGDAHNFYLPHIANINYNINLYDDASIEDHIPFQIFGYDNNGIRNVFAIVKDIICGHINQGGAVVQGYIETHLLPDIDIVVQSHIDMHVNELKLLYQQCIDNNKQVILNSIIPNIEEFNDLIIYLENMNHRLNQI